MNNHEKQDDAQLDSASIVHTAYADGRREISFINGLIDKISAAVTDLSNEQSLPMPRRRL